MRALLSAGLTDKDNTPVLVQQHADGGTALMRGDVDAWAGLDPMMAQHEIQEGARLFYRNAAANTWGILNSREEFLKENPNVIKRVLAAYEEARKYSLAHYDELKKDFITVTKLSGDVVRQAAQGAHGADPQPCRRRRSATRSWKPASRCRRPA